MKLLRGVGAVVTLTICVVLALPVIVRAAHALLVPMAAGVALYVVVRLVNAHLNRW